MYSTFMQRFLIKNHFSYNPIEDSLGVHMIRRIWDPVERIETETYHDLNGNLVEVLYGFCEVHYHLDEQLQPSQVDCYDKNGTLVEESGRNIAVLPAENG